MANDFATSEELGAILARKRKALSYTQTETARRAGVRQGTISDLENGRSVHLETLLRVAAVLKVRLYAADREATQTMSDTDWLEDL